MELYRKVRLACRDGMSERAAARHFGVSRQSVRKMLQFSVPPGYRRTAPVRRPKLDEFTGLIEQWLEDDRRHGYRKQRHTAKRIFERLRDEHGFTGGYTIVKDYVREHRRHRREMFVPLTHPPGHAQADFGEAWAVIAGVKQKVHFFAFDLPQSDASYVRAYRAATAEAWVDGHVHAFSFFGAVALSIVYDNDRCLVSRIERDGTRRRTRLFSGFLSHYLIGDRYGRPGKGNDKGAVEGLVGWSRRNFMVPLPRFASLEALNGYLEQRCRERQGDVLRGHRESIAKRLERDLEAMTALPGAPFDACHQAAGQVSSQSLVRYHNNDYSVPVAYGYRQVWVRAYDRITSILANQQTAAAFRSCCDVVLNMGDFEPVVDDGSERAASAGAPVQEARDRARASTHADVGFDAIRADIKTAIDEELAAAPEPVVIDSLAMRIQQRWPVVRESDWLGTGWFKNFLREVVDGNVRLSLTPPIRESIGLTVPVAGAVWRHQSPAWAWSENQFSRLTRSRSLPPGLKYAACRAGSATADPVRGLRATRAGRKRSEKLPKPRISIRPPSAARHAVICSSIVCTASATSPSPRWDCLRAIRSISSDFVIGPLSHCRARAVGSTR